MKHMRNRLILLMTSIVLVASFLSVPVSALITSNIVSVNMLNAFILGIAVREAVTPFLIILFCIIIIAISSSKAVSPIVELSNATKQIAAGNFDISIRGMNRKDESGLLARDFTLMAQELKSNAYLRKDFISNVSHEFKTPLSIISGYAELLDGDELTDKERHEYILTIQKESKRLIKLTSDLLSISKLENQKIQEQPVKFSLDEQIRQAVLLFQPDWSAKNIFLDIDVPKIMYVGNEALLAQVWNNLLDNAIKFTGDGGVICVYARVIGNSVTVKVSDDGEGMNEEVQARIFEQFFQGDSSHSKQGYGLGLALVKKIIEVSGGSISLTSKLGSGSTFVVTLPVHNPEK
jgi:signal transduction histidine kinase